MKTMTVKELREILKNVPGEYVVRTRAKNAHLDNDEVPWQVNFSGVVTEVKPIHSQRVVMLIRGFE